MIELIEEIITPLSKNQLHDSEVIHWGSPIPSFGDYENSHVATLGLNPSNLEFVDDKGNEIIGERRRFHSLNSLNIMNWSDAELHHCEQISSSCKNYFNINPYNKWFKKLEFLIQGSDYSYYKDTKKACHLDISPYATHKKWGMLSKPQKQKLIHYSRNSLAKIIKNSPISVLIINGRSAINEFEQISDTIFTITEHDAWQLPRANGKNVKGFSFVGETTKISNIKINKNLIVLGFNHNIQSSYGVTKDSMLSIREWLSSKIKGQLHE